MRNKIVDISARMKALTELVTPGSVVCDIGCDHGFVSIYLVQTGIADKVFAMDVRSGPLSHARAHIVEYGLEKSIETRLSDGLEALKKGEADCMICAGMGGPLMIKILTEGREKAQAMRELILQPQSEIAQFRQFLRAERYEIIKEDMILEDGKFYPVIKAIPGSVREERQRMEDITDQGFAQVCDLFGPYLLKNRHPVLKQYLIHSREVMEGLKQRLEAQPGERALARLPEISEELEWIYKALEWFR